jgi:hypothetical protein
MQIENLRIVSLIGSLGGEDFGVLTLHPIGFPLGPLDVHGFFNVDSALTQMVIEP